MKVNKTYITLVESDIQQKKERYIMMYNRQFANQMEDVQEKEAPFIFASYAHKDGQIAEKIFSEIENNSFRIWYDSGLHTGLEWTDEIGWRIANCAQFLVILSSSAVRSENVKNEIHLAKVYKRPFCIVYIEPVTLDYGLELQIGRIQAIHGYKMDDQSFKHKLIQSLNLNTRNEVKATITEAESKLQNNYELIGKIGAGGTATVFLARQKRTGASVAVKHAVIDSAISSRYVRRLFESEREILTRLGGCPYVPRLVDWYEDTENIYLVESLIEGDYLNAGDDEITEKKVVEIAQNVLKIFRYLKASRVIHKDVKPGNLKIDKEGTVFLFDFGCGRIVDENGYNIEAPMGTPGYAAPEQLPSYGKGIHTDYSTDMYGLGRTLIFLLLKSHLGSIEFREFDAGKGSIRYYRPDVSPALEDILVKMTFPSRHERYQNVADVSKALAGYESLPVIRKLILRWKSDKKVRENAKQIKASMKSEMPVSLEEDRTDITMIMANDKTELVTMNDRTVLFDECDTLF